MNRLEKARTPAQLRAALPETGRATWRDPSVRGLELLGRQAAATWYFRQTVNGRRLRDKIGAWPAMSHASAREAVDALTARRATDAAATSAEEALEKELEARRRRATRTGEVPTLAEIIGHWDHDPQTGRRIFAHGLYDYLAEKKSGAKIAAGMLAFFRPFLDTRVNRIDPLRFERHLRQRAEEAPSSSKKIIGTARPMWRWMAKNGWAQNIFDLVETPRVQDGTRDRDLRPVELAKIWIASHEEAEIPGAIIRTAMLTAQRAGDVLAMRIEDIDSENRLWRIPAAQTKTARDYLVPLSDDALAVIAALIGDRTAGYVFEGKTPGSHYNGWSKLSARMKARTEDLEPWTPHDFRAALVGRLRSEGVSVEVADACLNHAASSTVTGIARRYARDDLLDRRREAMDLYARIVRDAVAAEMGENVVALDGI